MGCWLTSTHCTQGVCDNHCYGNGSQYQDVNLACRVLLPVGYCSHFLISFTSTQPCCIVTVECKCRLLIWTAFNCYYLAAKELNTSLKTSLLFGKFFFFLSLSVSELRMLIKGFSMQCNFVCAQFHAASLSNFSHKQGIAVATKAGGGKHKIQINGICLANRTLFSARTKPRDICSLCGPKARLYNMSIPAGNRDWLLIWLFLF